MTRPRRSALRLAPPHLARPPFDLPPPLDGRPPVAGVARAVVLPAAATWIAFVAVETLRLRSSGMAGAVWGCVMLLVLYARPNWRVAVLAVPAIWLAQDVWRDSWPIEGPGIVFLALLLAVAASDPGVRAGAARHSWHGGAGALAAGTGATTIALSLLGQRSSANLLPALGLGLLVLSATSRRRPQLLARSGHRLLFVVAAGATAVGLVLDQFLTLGGSQAAALGVALSGVVWACCGDWRALRTWVAVAGWALAAWALLVSTDPNPDVLLALSWVAAAAVGLVVVSAAAAGLVGPAVPWRGRSMGAWGVVGLVGLLAGRRLLSSITDDQMWLRRTPLLVLSSLAVIALLLVVPWPAAVERAAAARGLRARAGRAADVGADTFVRFADAVERVLARCGRQVRRSSGWMTAAADPPDSPRPVAARLMESVAVPVGVWLAVASVMGAVARWAVGYDRLTGYYGILQVPWAVDPGGRIGWGTGDYWNLADHGYRLGEWLEPVFPLVPLLVRYTHRVTGLDLYEAQTIVAAVCGSATLVLYWELARLKGLVGRGRLVGLLFLALYPYSFLIYGYGYSDPTLVALVLGAFVLVERRRPILAGLVGALATAARPNSHPIILGLIVWELLDSGAVTLGRPAGAGGGLRASLPFTFDLRRMGVRRWGVLLSVAGVAGYSAWLIHHAGDPLYWLTAQSHYGHDAVTDIRTWLKSGFLDAPSVVVRNPLWAVNEAVHGLVLVTAIALLPALHRRLGSAYLVFTVGVFAIAWVGGRGFAAGGRYLLPTLPLFAIVIGDWAATRTRVQVALLSTCAVGMLLLVAAYGEGTYVLEW